MIAVAAEREDNVDLLLRLGASTGQRDASGHTEAHFCVHHSDMGVAKKLVAYDPDVTQDRDGYGRACMRVRVCVMSLPVYCELLCSFILPFFILPVPW